MKLGIHPQEGWTPNFPTTLYMLSRPGDDTEMAMVEPGAVGHPLLSELRSEQLETATECF